MTQPPPGRRAGGADIFECVGAEPLEIFSLMTAEVTRR